MKPEALDLDARTDELSREPSLSVGRDEDDGARSGRLKTGREVGDDSFGAAGAVRFDQVRDAAPRRRGRRDHPALRSRWKPPAHVSSSRSEIPAGTFTRRSDHGSAVELFNP